LENFAATDAEVQKLADELWGAGSRHAEAQTNYFGKGRVITGKSAREVLLADGVPPDCEFLSTTNHQPSTDFDFIHRTTDDAEIYFVANRSTNAVAQECAFRVSGKAPELWNAVTGERKFAAYEETAGRTFVPLDFAPCGSWFVVFREPASAHPAGASRETINHQPSTISSFPGAWTVHFDPKWGGPETAQFDTLASWPTRPEPGIKFYSGTAVYEKTFNVSDSALRTPHSALVLDLGDVRELAEVKVNGQSCGILWCPPWRVDVTAAVKPGENKLQIEVVNFWPNRIIGDASMSPEQRFTQTNIRKLTARTPLEAAGLFGPVKLLEDEPAK